MARNASPRRGASPPAASRRQVPGWVWLFTGVVTGLFIAFLVHLANLQRDQPPTTAGRESAPAEEPASSNGPRFDFYAVLPKMEVILPKSEESELRQRDQPARTPEGEQLEHRHQQQFLLQAGSFRNASDADRRRAELILEGFDAHLQPVRMDSGDTWHRVMIGPFNNANAMHRAQDKLANGGIETLAIRVREED